MKGPKGIMSPVEMVSVFDKTVRGQDEAKRQLSIALFNRHRRSRLNAEDRRFVKKQNILIEGPTGSGKTALMRVLREDFGLPVLEVDITEYSEAGYHGKSVDDMINELQRVDFTVPKWFNQKEEPKVKPAPITLKAESNSFGDDPVRDKDTAVLIVKVLRILTVGMIGGRLYPPFVVENPNISSMLHASVEDYISEKPEYLVEFFRRGIDLVEKHCLPIEGPSAAYTQAVKEMPFNGEEMGDKDKEPSEEFLKNYGLNGKTVVSLMSSLVDLDVADYTVLWDIKTPLSEVTEWPKVALAGEKSGFYRERLKGTMIGYFFRSLIVGMIKTEASKLEEHVSRTMAMQKYDGKDMAKQVTFILAGHPDAHAQSIEKLKTELRAGMGIMSQERLVQLQRGFRSWTNQLNKLKLGTKSELLFPPRVTTAWDELKDMSFDDYWKQVTADIITRSAKEIRDEVNNASLIFSPNSESPDFGGMVFRPMGGRPDFPGGLGAIFGMGRGGPQVGGDSKDFLENFAVVFIDEIDKLIQEPGRSGDVSRMGVQRGLLKLVEGGIYAGIDTSNILFVGAGAFSGTSPAKLLPELVGRFPIRARLKALNSDDYVAICKLERSPFNMYIKMLATDDVKVVYDDDTFEYIAQLTELENQEFNLGARRIDGIIERVFAPAMFEPEKYLEHGYDIRGETLRKHLRG